MKAFGRAGFTSEHTGEAGPGAVRARLECVAGCACAKSLRSGHRITSGSSIVGRGENQTAIIASKLFRPMITSRH